MIKKKLVVYVDDGWMPGWCDHCPLGYCRDEYDWYNCALEGDAEHCPLEDENEP